MSKIVGILNITPDSFSDGGLYITPEKALSRIQEMIDAGADIIDIGAESTRPDATPLSPQDEWKRLEPVLDAINNSDCDIELSIDTYHPETIEKALKYNIAWINDVSGFEDQRMVDLALKHNCKIVLMHNLGVPAKREVTLSNKKSAVKQVYEWAEKKINELEKQGINRERIIFDPGIGFGKTAEQSFELIKYISFFKKLGTEILVGHSEKSFIKLFSDNPPGKRGTETQILSAHLSSNGVDYLRVHDVDGNKRAISASQQLVA